MVKLGKRDLKVKDARKILTQYNKEYKKEEFGKRGKGGVGVYRMGTAKLEQELKMFRVSKDGKSVKHKTNVKFDYKLPESDKQPPIGKGGVSMKAKKNTKMKKQTAKDKKDESKGMKGQKKKTKSKTDKGDENYTGKKGDISKSKGKDVGKVNSYRDFVKMKGGVSKVGKGEWAKYKKKNKL